MAPRLVASTLLLVIACSSAGSPGSADDSSGPATTDPAETGVATTGATAAPATTTTLEPGTDATGVADTAPEDTGDDVSTGDDGPPPPTMPTMLPTATGTCPTLADGDVVFAPAGVEPRSVRVWMSDAAATMDGPLVFYWHGTGSAPQEALYGLGADLVPQILAMGGIVVAPAHDPAAGDFPWFLVVGDREDDLLLADDILACAIDQVGVDLRHIHVAGMSAGGLMTSQMSFRRSGYIASAVPYSGGIIVQPPDQEPRNPMAAMIFHGGKDDIVVLHFEQTSDIYRDTINARGGFAYTCDHGMGHTIPQGSAQASVWQFFADHPYGTKPSPYKSGLPNGFPDYCTLP